MLCGQYSCLLRIGRSCIALIIFRQGSSNKSGVNENNIGFVFVQFKCALKLLGINFKSLNYKSGVLQDLKTVYLL